jgi:hypothetical protein
LGRSKRFSFWKGHTGNNRYGILSFADLANEILITVKASNAREDLTNAETGPTYSERSASVDHNSDRHRRTGLITVVWQIGKQYRLNLDLQREHLQDELHLKIYKDLADQIIAAQLAIGKVMSWLSVTEVQVASNPLDVKFNNQDLVDKHFESQSKLSPVIQILETFEIVIPRSRVFRLAFSEQASECHKRLTEVLPELSKILAYQMVKGTTDVTIQEQVARSRDVIESYAKSTGELESYLADLQIEAQNHLLSSLFKRRVPKRHPGDPNALVISTDDEGIKKTVAYFVSKSNNPQSIRLEEYLEPPSLEPLGKAARRGS